MTGRSPEDGAASVEDDDDAVGVVVRRQMGDLTVQASRHVGPARVSHPTTSGHDIFKSLSSFAAAAG